MSHMISIAAASLALGAVLAVPAAAKTSVKVDITGLAAPAAHARILKVAATLCEEELGIAWTLDPEQQINCIIKAVAGAEAQMKKMRASAANPAVIAGR